VLRSLASELELKSSRLTEHARDDAEVDEAILEKAVMALDDACCIEIMQVIGNASARQG
jgi:hypothetical protein